MACFFEETMGTDCALENDWVVSTEHELVGRTNMNILSSGNSLTEFLTKCCMRDKSVIYEKKIRETLTGDN